MHAVWHPFYHPESCSKEVSGLVAASAQEAHVIKGKRVNILKLGSRITELVCRRQPARKQRLDRARSTWASCQWMRFRTRI